MPDKTRFVGGQDTVVVDEVVERIDELRDATKSGDITAEEALDRLEDELKDW